MMLAGLGIIGLVLGAAMPMPPARRCADSCRPAEGGVLHPSALALATAYGLLTAFVFAVWPLSQAQETCRRLRCSARRAFPTGNGRSRFTC
jgi:putative ABC transport system permease protein